MVHFVGAGPGAPDLITLRGAELLRQADVVIYAGSLVNPALLELCGADCAIYNSAQMTLEQILEAMQTGENIVRLHTGDPCLYGAIREQMDALDKLGIPYDVTPGVSSFCGAAAALGAEYTLPGVSQRSFFCRRECWRSCKRSFYKELTPRTPRRRWCIGPPGRRKERCAVPWGPWPGRGGTIRSARPPWCWWEISWAGTTGAVF